DPFPQSIPGDLCIKTFNSGGRTQELSDRIERNLAGVGFAEGGEHLDSTCYGHSRNLAHQTAFTDTRRSHHSDNSAVTVDCSDQQPLDGRHLRAPTDQIRFSAP